MNTAQYRDIAYEAQQKGDFKKAYKNFKLAIKHYPSSQKVGSLYSQDIANLKSQAENSRKEMLKDE